MCILNLKFLNDESIYSVSLSNEYVIDYQNVSNFDIPSRSELVINEPYELDALQTFLEDLIFNQHKVFINLEYMELVNLDRNKTMKIMQSQMAQLTYLYHFGVVQVPNRINTIFNCSFGAMLKQGEEING